MAVPLTPDRMITALANEGVTFREHTGWRTHNRNGAGTWGPVNGVMIHHTAGRDSLGLVWSGTQSLPGPLAHAHLAKSGLVTLTANGRANHAGRGSRAVYDAVVNEVTAPRPGPDEVDGNTHFYGLEIENLGNGTDPYPDAQYRQAVLWAAAICRAHGWSERSVIGHKEWTTRKIDPSFDMRQFRTDVGHRLARGEDTPVTDVPGKDIEAPKPLVYSQVLETDSIPAPSNHPDADEHRFWTGESYLRFIAEKLITIERKLS